MCNTTMLLIAMFWFEEKGHYSLGLRSSPQFSHLFQGTLSKVVSRIYLYQGSPFCVLMQYLTTGEPATFA